MKIQDVVAPNLALLEAHEPDETHLQQLADILQPVRLFQVGEGPVQADREGHLCQSLWHHHLQPVHALRKLIDWRLARCFCYLVAALNNW